MMKNIFEILVGAIVLVVALGFVVMAYKTGSVKEVDGYTLKAKFDRVDGLSKGSDVRVSGLKVGKVVEQEIDPDTYLAIIKVSVDDKVKVPSDSTAEIISDGLLGSKYVAIVPGGSEEMLKDGDEIKFTQSSVSIESLIGKFMFSDEDKDKKDEDKPSSTSEKPKSEEDIF